MWLSERNIGNTQTAITSNSSSTSGDDNCSGGDGSSAMYTVARRVEEIPIEVALLFPHLPIFAAICVVAFIKNRTIAPYQVAPDSDPRKKIFDNGDLLYEKGQVSEALAGGSVVSVVWVVSTQVGGRQQKMKSIPTKIKQVGLISTRIQ